MKISDLDFSYPENLVATQPLRPSRVLLVDHDKISETSLNELCEYFKFGDLLVINDTKVEARRIFAKSESGGTLEILFVEKLDEWTWKVLFPSRRLKLHDKILMPDQVIAELVQMGRPQTVKLSRPITSDYFEQFGEMPLPPYIQKAREKRHVCSEDREWYQTQWAQKLGSSAAPTASLHFTKQDLESLQDRGILVQSLTLHVGLGTYLPVSTEDLDDHKMHYEHVEIPKTLVDSIKDTQARGGRIWALGTTTTRALEAWASYKLEADTDGSYKGQTDLLIQPGFSFKVVDVLLTNFHQPQSTLLALVMAFSERKRVLEAYNFAINHHFRLFSFGDLSVWFRK